MSGYQNVMSDHLSRFQTPEARQLAPWLDSHPVVPGTHTLERELVLAALASTTRAAYRRSMTMLRDYIAFGSRVVRIPPLSQRNMAGFINICTL